MKKTMLFVTGILFLSALSNAQSVRWGVKAGANFSNINAQSSEASWGSRTGVHV